MDNLSVSFYHKELQSCKLFGTYTLRIQRSFLKSLFNLIQSILLVMDSKFVTIDANLFINKILILLFLVLTMLFILYPMVASLVQLLLLAYSMWPCIWTSFLQISCFWIKTISILSFIFLRYFKLFMLYKCHLIHLHWRWLFWSLWQ